MRKNNRRRRYSKKRYSKKRYSKKRYSKKRYSKKRYSKKRYSKKRYSKNMKGGVGNGWDDVDLSPGQYGKPTLKRDQFILQCGHEHELGTLDEKAKDELAQKLINTKPLQLKISESSDPTELKELKALMRQKILAVIARSGGLPSTVVQLNVNSVIAHLHWAEVSQFENIMKPP